MVSGNENVTWDWEGVGWPRNGYLVISRNTKLDEIKHFFAEFRRNSAKFRGRILPKFRIFSRNTSVNFAEFRGILSNFAI